MAALLRDNWKFLFLALMLHTAVGALLTLELPFAPRRIESTQLAIQARIVDQSALQRASDADRQAKERERREREAQEQQQREQEQEAQRKQKETQEQAQLQAKQTAEQKKKDDAARIKREQTEKQRVADIKRKQDEKKKAEQEAKAQAQRERELKQQLAEEDARQQARNSGLLNQYKMMIEQHVMRRWNRPASARPGLECEVLVTQVPGGAVTSTKLGKCNGDTAVRQSIEDAVMRSSPLPAPPDARLFERQLLIIFKPTESETR